MISPVSHSSHADQAEQTRSTQAKPRVQKTNDNNRTANVQDTVTVKNTSDVDHDGDTKWYFPAEAHDLREQAYLILLPRSRTMRMPSFSTEKSPIAACGARELSDGPLCSRPASRSILNVNRNPLNKSRMPVSVSAKLPWGR